ncbi:MAG: bifunctional hydroxymethylpyrimidine kinase/phosphomethylpyrimidine kinase [Pyrinomonadaceae bacterium]
MTNTSTGDSPPVGLTIAGFDPSGGAGVIADVRTFASFGCFATAAITSLTFQNTTGVFGALHQSAATVRAQVTPILRDFTIACVKTGMLPTREVIGEVARLFRATEIPSPVVDPVMRATSGDDLIDDDAVSCLVAELFPLARLVTPNIPEAERLTGLSINDEEGMREAAKIICGMGAAAVLVKGGHLGARKPEGPGQKEDDSKQKTGVDQGATLVVSRKAIDVLVQQNAQVTVFREELIAGGEFHGSGCTLSAAIAASLAKGLNLEDSIRAAKRFVTDAIRRAPQLGHGARPLP